jgi:hypothetical protein
MTLAALAVLLGVSCTEIEKPGDDGWTELGGDRPVLFHSSFGTLATKSEPLPNNTYFGVFAFYQPGGTWNNNRKPDFMFNQEVLFDGTDYTYTPVRYWPSNVENTLSFWAYSPYDPYVDLLQRGSKTNAYTSNTANTPDIRFTVIDGHTDFLYSNIVKSQTYATNSGIVPFVFNHALSLIDVRAEKVDPDGKYTVTLKSVSFKDLYMTAILKSSDWTWYTYSGARQNLPVWEDDPADDADDKVLSHASSIPVESVMPLPQDFNLNNDYAKLRVEYSVSYLNDPLDPSSVRSYSTFREVYLKEVFLYAGSSWTKNSHYVLTLKIIPGNPIQFTVSWSDWGDVFNYSLTD